MKMCKLCKDCEALAGALVCADCFERGHNITPDIGDDDDTGEWPEYMTPELRAALEFMGAVVFDDAGGCKAIRFDWLDDGKERTYTHIIDAYTVTPEVRAQWRRNRGPSTGHAMSATDAIWKDGTRWIEPTCPESLDDQCATVYFRETLQDGEWVADMGLSDDGDQPGRVTYFDSVRDALLELYGNSEGNIVPAVLTAGEHGKLREKIASHHERWTDGREMHTGSVFTGADGEEYDWGHYRTQFESGLVCSICNWDIGCVCEGVDIGPDNTQRRVLV